MSTHDTLGQEQVQVMQVVIMAIECMNSEELAEIQRIVTARRNTLARDTLYELRPGDTVRFTSAIRPQYLIGLTARVIRVNATTVAVEIEDREAAGRFSQSRYVRVPPTLLERVDILEGRSPKSRAYLELYDRR